jgi:NADH dehydrogenase
VFVVGDMASLEGYDGDSPYPMVAQVAIQQGRQAAKNIIARETGKEPGAFRYFDKGQMAIIGRRAAVVDGFGVKLKGGLAWLAWLALHILYLRGFRNRLIVMLDWLAAYVSPTRGAGVITRPEAHDRVERVQDRVVAARRRAAPDAATRRAA